MGLLDGIMNAVGGVEGAENGAVQLASLFGNTGLQDIVARLQASGLDQHVQSWISTGANMPVNLEQVQAALGPDTIQQVSTALGIDPSQIGTALPGLISHLSPNGELPTGHIGDMLNQLGGAGGLNSMISGLFKA